ncbi:DUF4232 domain-containing protein [Mycobacterium lacus]|uniref:DUF4232 domain-containing protein n=1 Tax=Mycobacterium lacus TaxID=169765 RepID=UPI000A15504B|nr:DUF4232 domain-containing protein [Mycobacterium lacus]MCV7125340.1 DUF4232 domain-containing protein [Mycobacterium lacus]
MQRRARRAVATGVLATTSCAAVVLGPAAWAAPADTGEEPTPCKGEQIAVSTSPTQVAVGHRALTLIFTLASGAAPCTLSGYPDVESGAGGPLIHAKPTPRGYMGGLPATDTVPPTATLSLAQRAQAIVEGMAIDGNGNQCPTYTDLRVNLPNTVEVFTVPTTIEACQLQVHPITDTLSA